VLQITGYFVLSCGRYGRKTSVHYADKDKKTYILSSDNQSSWLFTTDDWSESFDALDFGEASKKALEFYKLHTKETSDEGS
jgi:hypothetical protein